MGVTFLCNATRKAYHKDIPKTLNVASETYASVESTNQGGKINSEANMSLVVTHNKTSRIQEMHGLVIHLICKLIDLKLVT